MTKEITKKKHEKGGGNLQGNNFALEKQRFLFFIIFPVKLFRTQQLPTKTGNFDFLLQRMLCIGKHMYGRGQKADVILHG